MEIDYFKKLWYRLSLITFTFECSNRLCILFTITMVYVFQTEKLSTEAIFPVVQYLLALRMNTIVLFSIAAKATADCNVSVTRIQNFLLLEEIELKIDDIKSSDNIVSMENVSAFLLKSSRTDGISNVNLLLLKNKLYFIVGPIGSGKSSLLKLILDELCLDSGRIQVHGRVSYASQEPWLFNGSIRDNILFGEVYNEAKYRQVVDACDLQEDFNKLPFGDRTLVGERGTSLSGGQRARINIARSIYRDAEIYLIDDSLSAVDTQTSKSIFEKCICRYLKDKTRIVVINNSQHFASADEIIGLNNGEIQFKGDLSSLQNNEIFINSCLKEIKISHKVKKHANQKITSAFKMNNEEKSDPKETDELMAKGDINKSLYWRYFKANGSWVKLFFLSIICILSVCILTGFDVWFVMWTQKEEIWIANTSIFSNLSSFESSDKITEFSYDYSSLYGLSILMVLMIICSISKAMLFFNVLANAGENIHNKMLSRILQVPLQFFEIHPSGQLLNRFTEDVGIMDDIIPQFMIDAIVKALFVITSLISIIIVNGLNIFPLIVVIYGSVKVSKVFISTIQQIKRFEAIAKSPMLTFAASSLTGVSTIRSCKAQTFVQKTFDRLQDHYTSFHSLVLALSEAFSFWLDTITILFFGAATFCNLLFMDRETSGAYVNLVILQFFNIFWIISHTVKNITETHTLMINIERIFQFVDLKQEDEIEKEKEIKPLICSFDRGEISIKNLYLRYFDEDEPILKNINLSIEAKTKIGIVGRTGSGKSSLISALFRFANFDGSIIIDGTDTKQLNLETLRANIFVIPQEPFLISASLRTNLDPLNQFDDLDLWSALEEVELKNIFNSLDQPINQAGANLSVGERQLLCLARAILKKRKILILDEATANIDSSTDELIQKVIRFRFKDCTVLTIAHKLNTIMDCDKVLVLDDGQVVEYDHPHVLLQNQDGFLMNLVKEADGMEEHLTNMAQKAYMQVMLTTMHATSEKQFSDH